MSTPGLLVTIGQSPDLQSRAISIRYPNGTETPLFTLNGTADSKGPLTVTAPYNAQGGPPSTTPLAAINVNNTYFSGKMNIMLHGQELQLSEQLSGESWKFRHPHVGEMRWKKGYISGELTLVDENSGTKIAGYRKKLESKDGMQWWTKQSGLEFYQAPVDQLALEVFVVTWLAVIEYLADKDKAGEKVASSLIKGFLGGMN